MNDEQYKCVDYKQPVGVAMFIHVKMPAGDRLKKCFSRYYYYNLLWHRLMK